MLLAEYQKDNCIIQVHETSDGRIYFMTNYEEDTAYLAPDNKTIYRRKTFRGYEVSADKVWVRAAYGGFSDEPWADELKAFVELSELKPQE